MLCRTWTAAASSTRPHRQHELTLYLAKGVGGQSSGSNTQRSSTPPAAAQHTSPDQVTKPKEGTLFLHPRSPHTHAAPVVSHGAWSHAAPVAAHIYQLTSTLAGEQAYVARNTSVNSNPGSLPGLRENLTRIPCVFRLLCTICTEPALNSKHTTQLRKLCMYSLRQHTNDFFTVGAFPLQAQLMSQPLACGVSRAVCPTRETHHLL